MRATTALGVTRPSRRPGGNFTACLRRLRGRIAHDGDLTTTSPTVHRRGDSCSNRLHDGGDTPMADRRVRRLAPPDAGLREEIRYERPVYVQRHLAPMRITTPEPASRRTRRPCLGTTPAELESAMCRVTSTRISMTSSHGRRPPRHSTLRVSRVLPATVVIVSS